MGISFLSISWLVISAREDDTAPQISRKRWSRLEADNHGSSARFNQRPALQQKRSNGWSGCAHLSHVLYHDAEWPDETINCGLVPLNVTYCPSSPDDDTDDWNCVNHRMEVALFKGMISIERIRTQYSWFKAFLCNARAANAQKRLPVHWIWDQFQNICETHSFP